MYPINLEVNSLVQFIRGFTSLERHFQGETPLEFTQPNETPQLRRLSCFCTPVAFLIFVVSSTNELNCSLPLPQKSTMPGQNSAKLFMIHFITMNEEIRNVILRNVIFFQIIKHKLHSDTQEVFFCRNIHFKTTRRHHLKWCQQGATFSQFILKRIKFFGI